VEPLIFYHSLLLAGGGNIRIVYDVHELDGTIIGDVGCFDWQEVERDAI
jgi:hypothetical protein